MTTSVSVSRLGLRWVSRSEFGRGPLSGEAQTHRGGMGRSFAEDASTAMFDASSSGEVKCRMVFLRSLSLSSSSPVVGR
jgi:hypothetical protein